MEHIVQFAIGIDDKAIQNRIEEHAYADVLAKLTDHKPLFGNKQPNRTGTHWIVFIKEDTE